MDTYSLEKDPKLKMEVNSLVSLCGSTAKKISQETFYFCLSVGVLLPHEKDSEIQTRLKIYIDDTIKVLEEGLIQVKKLVKTEGKEMNS